MQIHRMVATFGKLERSELVLQPGLNVIYAPNESGKSTWTAFLRNMFYGLNTRDRGDMADKNRYAPWSGSAMLGRIELESGGKDYTLVRQTRRANAPMGDFSCTFSSTADPVPGITAQNAGEHLLGISRDVFERSAFIAQSSLSVEQSTELERRIAALITTGEEDTSYSEANERLKKQLNRRRHNKTGQIPALEREIADLDASLARLDDLQTQHRQSAQQLELLRTQQAELLAQQRQWELLEQQEQQQQYRAARQAAAQANAKREMLREIAGKMPDEETLTRLEHRCALLAAGAAEAERSDKADQAAAAAARSADDACRRHPLYPSDEDSLRGRIDNMTPPDMPAVWPVWLGLVVTLLALVTAVLSFLYQKPPALWIACGAVGLSSLAAAFGWRLLLQRTEEQRKKVIREKEALLRQTEAYLPLRQTSLDTAARAAAAHQLYTALCRQQQEGVDALVLDLSPFRHAADLGEATLAIKELRRQADAAAAAAQAAREAELRCQLLAQHQPKELPSSPNTPVARPATSLAQLQAALPQVTADIQLAQSRLDTLVGQIRSLGDADELSARRAEKAEQLALLQQEYDAIALAMDALDRANLTLQSRFAPALGQRAAEIFSGITGGRYQKVLLSRDFSLSAEPAADASMRSVHLLSQGAADQLYLAVRLAICDLVLPPEYSVPLILDDALVSFDEERLHAALDYLVQEAQRRQILLFTCQRREASYLANHSNTTLLTL